MAFATAAKIKLCFRFPLQNVFRDFPRVMGPSELENLFWLNSNNFQPRFYLKAKNSAFIVGFDTVQKAKPHTTFIQSLTFVRILLGMKKGGRKFHQKKKSALSNKS